MFHLSVHASASCICVLSSVCLFLVLMYRYFHEYCFVRVFHLSLHHVFDVSLYAEYSLFSVFCLCLCSSALLCTRVRHQISIYQVMQKTLNPSFIRIDKRKKKPNGKSIIVYRTKMFCIHVLDATNVGKILSEFLECSRKVLNIC